MGSIRVCITTHLELNNLKTLDEKTYPHGFLKVAESSLGGEGGKASVLNFPRRRRKLNIHSLERKT